MGLWHNPPRNWVISIFHAPPTKKDTLNNRLGPFFIAQTGSFHGNKSPPTETRRFTEILFCGSTFARCPSHCSRKDQQLDIPAQNHERNDQFGKRTHDMIYIYIYACISVYMYIMTISISKIYIHKYVYKYTYTYSYSYVYIFMNRFIIDPELRTVLYQFFRKLFSKLQQKTNIFRLSGNLP